ncbi:MAG: hypothetical protein AAGG48_09140 [Planctomycetota bacterium]
MQLSGSQLPVFRLFIFLISCLHVWEASPVAAEVQVGIEGHYRLGHWTAIRYDQPFDAVETRDGDGVEIRFEQLNPESEWGYLVPGSEAAPLILRRSDEAVESTRFPTVGSPSRGPAMIPLKTPWIVAFGDPMGVDEIGYNEILQRDATFAVSKPKEPTRLPDSHRGYDGVDLLMISGSSVDLLQGLQPEQKTAIQEWLTEGGRLFLTLGESAPDLFQAAPWLLELLPIEAATIESLDPSSFETFMSSQSRLDPIRGVKLPLDKGQVLLMGRTSRRVGVPFAVEYNVGFGRITAVAADLDSESFAQWPNRLEMITRLTGSILQEESTVSNRTNRATAYDDLAGQLRSTLDQFAVRRNFGFSIVSLILMALIAMLGPLDYLLVNRLFGRPLLGWISFPITTIGLSAILVFQARPVPTAQAIAESAESSTVSQGALPSSVRSDIVRCNRIEFFDLDTIQGIGRGFSASFLYSQAASRFDVHVDPTESFMTITDAMKEVVSTPFGYPGQSFGGIQIAIEDSRLPVYSLQYEKGPSANPYTGTKLLGLPIASRSSKGLSTWCRFQPSLPPTTMQHRPGSELLQGELVNPLPFDLLDGMLIYRNWAYLLPTRFPVGGRIGSVDSLRQKNFRWQLSRQRALENSSESEAWDPTNTNSIERVSEMLMFHESVGGERYTSLDHGPLQFLDLSHVLADDRCILIGRIKKPLTEFRVHEADEVDYFAPDGDRLSMIRVVLPVVEAETN